MTSKPRDRAVRFSVAKLRSLLAKRPQTRTDYRDAAYPGLYLRVGPRSATWSYMCRINGKLTRLKLGEDRLLAERGKATRSASFTIARKLAGEIEEQLAAGKHPKAEQARAKEARSEAVAKDEGRIIRNVADAWIAAGMPTHKPRKHGKLAPSTEAAYKSLVANFVAAHGDADVGTIRRGAIKRYLDGVAKRSASTANQSATVIRLLFAFAQDRFDLDVNPASDIRNPASPRVRKRTLSREEVRVLWRACEAAGWPYGHALRFALCTGQRIGEIGMLRRGDIDSDSYWTQTRNKSRKRIDILVTGHARQIIDDCPNLGPDSYYFSASSGEHGLPADRWSHAIPRRIKPLLEPAAKALGLPPITQRWTPHDLRRTVRTGLTGWALVSPDTAERVLNHVVGGLRGIYDHADYKPHVADALEQWDSELTRLLQGKQSTRETKRKERKR